MNTRITTLATLIIVAILSRLLPHPWNWTAVGGAALLAGARFDRLIPAMVVPLTALLITDLVLGFHVTIGFVYGAFLLTTLGAYFLREWLTGWKVAVGALISANLFFVVSNFGVWWVGGFYSPDFQGLIACYTAAIPFYGSQVMGDLVWSGVLFFAWDAVLAPSRWLQKAI